MTFKLASSIPLQLRVLAKHLNKELGVLVYLVGGAVRDLFLNRPTKDYDLVVAGVEAKILEKWLSDHGQVNLVGKFFGVYKWQPAGWAGEAIDVALPRTEHVAVGSGQYRDFKVQTDPNLPIEQDLLRRDFTINALALDLINDHLVDPAGGVVDIRYKTIRTVGRPTIRFKEDLSRTLRALRFACQLGFKIENKTLQAIKSLSQKCALGQKGGEWLVPREIVARELLKSLAANSAQAVDLLDETGFIKRLLPEVYNLKGVPQPPQFHSEGDVWQHTKMALEALTAPEWRQFFGQAQPSLNVVVATLLHDIGKPLTLKTPSKNKVDRIRTDGHDIAGAELALEICQRLKLSSYVDAKAGQIKAETVAWLVKNHLLLAHGQPQVFKPHTIYRYFLQEPVRGQELQQVIFADMHATRPQDGHSLLPKLKELQKIINQVQKKLTAGKLKLLLTGEEIMTAFQLSPGPKVGQLLKRLEEAQLAGLVKTKRQAKIWLRNQL